MHVILVSFGTKALIMYLSCKYTSLPFIILNIDLVSLIGENGKVLRKHTCSLHGENSSPSIFENVHQNGNKVCHTIDDP